MREKVVDRAWWDRWAPVTGIVFIVVLMIGYLMLGEPPALTDPAQEFADTFREDRGQILAGSIIIAVSVIFFVLFAAALASRVRDAGEPRPAAAIVGGGAAFAAMLLVVLGMLAAIAHTAAEEVEPAVAKGLALLVIGVDVMSFIPFAVLVLAFGVAVLRSGVLAAWFGHASLVAAILIALGATTWAREGFWAPYDGYGFVAFIVFIVWIVAVSVLLIARPPAPRAGGTSAPTSSST